MVPNTSRFRSELKAQLEGIEHSLEGHVPVSVDLDAGAARAEMADLTRARTAKVNVDIDSTAFAVKFAKLRAALAKDAKIKVDVEVDQNRVQRTLSSLGDKISSIFSKTPSAGGGGVPLGSFADTAVLVAAVASVAAPALALLTGALVALPAALTSVLVPIGAVALGLDGLKKAAEVVQPEVDALKQTMSQRFQDVFTPILEKTKAVFPALQQSLPKVASALGDVATAFVNTLTSQSGLDRIHSTIDNIAAAISRSAPGIGKLADGMLTLVDKVAAKLPGVADFFNKIGDSFQKWVTKITTPNWLTGQSPLDRGLKSFGDTIHEFLNLGGDLLKKGFDFLSDPKFGDSMKNFVADVKDLVNNVLPGLGQFFQDLSGAITGVNDLINNIKGIKLPDLGGDKNAGGKNDSNIIPGTKNSFSPGVLKDNPFTETVNSWQATVAILGQLAVQAFFNIKTAALQAFTDIGTQIGTIFGNVWGTVTSTASAAWNGVTAVIQGALSGISGTISQIPAMLASAWGSLGSIASGAWQAVVAAVRSALQQAVAAVVAGAGQIVAEVVALGGKVVGACANFGSLLVGAGRALVQGLINGITSMIGAAVAKAAELAAAVANAAKSALGIHSPSKVFTEIGQQTAQGLQDGLEGGFQGVIDRARALSQQLTDAVNGGLAGTDSKSLLDPIKKQLDEIDIEKKTLKLQSDNTTDKGQKSALKDQMSQLQTLRDQLSLQSEQLGFSQKYGDQTDETAKSQQMVTDSVSKLVDLGKNFAMANANQFMQDLGISGQGAIPQVADQLLNWGLGLIPKLIGGGGDTFNVSSAEDAIRIRDNKTNRQAIGVVGR